jgi:hypothetical protein
MKLTDAQIRKLADKLIDTSKNVYREVGEGVEFSDEDFDRLESVGGVFKCEECNQWKSVSEKDPAYLHNRIVMYAKKIAKKKKNSCLGRSKRNHWFRLYGGLHHRLEIRERHLIT